MQPTNSYSRPQFLREVLELTKRRMMSRVANATVVRANANSSSPVSLSTELTTNENLVAIVLGLVYIFIMIVFSSGSYNRFGFMMNEESDFESDLSDVESASSSPVSSRPTLSTFSSKCLHLQTPVQIIYAVTPKTPAPPPLRRSLRLKIKSELNLCAMQNNSGMTTRSQTKQPEVTTTAMTISSEPCPKNRHHDSMTTPSPHPEHDEEREYYIRYCNEKKMRKQRPEFNSPLFVRRLVL